MSKASPTIEFGTDGWRGIIAQDFTFANVCRVTRAIARYLDTAYAQDRPVLVGYDTRFLAEQFAATAAAVLAELGWRVQLVDRDCPTPVLAYSARQLGSAGALMFTASHNPPSYCGIKYIPDYAGPATSDITDAIVAQLDRVTSAPPSGCHLDRIHCFDPKPDYLRFLYGQLDVERIRRARLAVQYDALYSTSRGYLDAALEHCGCVTETLHAHRDVLFGDRLPEPKGQQLDQLVAAVRRTGAAVGLATDGDSDRFGIVDESGNILTPNSILLLLARHLLRHRGKTGAIVRTVATTHLLDRLAHKYGVEVVETAVGFKHIGQKMREMAVLIGGEESGGLSVSGHIPEKDGILAGMLVVEAIASAEQPLSQLVAEVVAEAGGALLNHRVDLRLSNAEKAAVLQAFHTQPPTEIAGIPVRAIGRKDGIKLYLEDESWVLLRPSGTEPLLRISLETDRPEKQEKITAAMQQIVQQTLP